MYRSWNHLCSQFTHSFRSLSRTRTITTVGLLLAMQIVLSSYGVLQLSDSLKVSLAHLAITPTAILFGPIAACIQGALSDIVGYLLKPTGPYFPGFTLSAALLGLVYGLFFYESKQTTVRIILARLVVCVFINILLNTVFLVMLYGPSRMATFPIRVFKNLIQLPIDCLLLSAVCRIVKRIPHAQI